MDVRTIRFTRLGIKVCYNLFSVGREEKRYPLEKVASPPQLLPKKDVSGAAVQNYKAIVLPAAPAKVAPKRYRNVLR